MSTFEPALLRLKEQLGVPTDKEAAELLGLTDKALNARKRRDSFPTNEVFALAAKRPDLGLDPDWIVTGYSNRMQADTNAETALIQCFRKMDDADQRRLLNIALLWSGEMGLAIRKPPEPPVEQTYTLDLLAAPAAPAEPPLVLDLTAIGN
jgi:hypothetical protein